VAALEKVRCLRKFHPELGCDHRQAIRWMFVKQPFQKDGPTMMVGGRELANVEQSGNSRGCTPLFIA
jgi:hypothetical protein